MKFLLHLLKHYPFSCLCIVIIWVLCFMDVPDTPLGEVAFMDKWTHMVMCAGTCGVIAIEYWRQHEVINKKRWILLGWLAPVLMSGLIEWLQANCTGGRRSGEWMDFLANTTGATLILCVGILWEWCRARR
jgi:VanZ family protein